MKVYALYFNNGEAYDAFEEGISEDHIYLSQGKAEEVAAYLNIKNDQNLLVTHNGKEVIVTPIIYEEIIALNPTIIKYWPTAEAFINYHREVQQSGTTGYVYTVRKLDVKE